MLEALLVLTLVWSILVCARWVLDPILGVDAAVLASFGAAASLLLATRSYRGDRGIGVSFGLFLVGACGGFLGYPALVSPFPIVGSLIGLSATAPVNPASRVQLLLAVVLAAPIFEELLYRERLLTAFQRAFGPSKALVLSSLLFAAPHLGLGRVLGTFVIGVLLGGLMMRGRSVALCAGLHAGLNAASMLCGLPPARLALEPLASAVAGSVVVAVAIEAARRLSPQRTLRLGQPEQKPPPGTERAVPRGLGRVLGDARGLSPEGTGPGSWPDAVARGTGGALVSGE